MTRLCSGCGLKWCEGQCYLEDPIPEEEETISKLTLSDLKALYGNPLTELLPENKDRWVA